MFARPIYTWPEKSLQEAGSKGSIKVSAHLYVSAGAKIPIVPVENSPAPGRCGVTPTLEDRGGPTSVQGEGRGSDQSTQARRTQHSGDQQSDRVRPENHQEVFVDAGDETGLRAQAGASEQAVAIRTIPSRAPSSRRLECAGIASRTAWPDLYGRVHDSDGLAATTTSGGTCDRRTQVRDAAGQTGPGRLGPRWIARRRRGST